MSSSSQPAPLVPRRAGAPGRVLAELEFSVTAEPADVERRFLASPEVALLQAYTGHGEDPGYALERSPRGFYLTADPGAWRPGTRAICEVELTPEAEGARVVVRFRLHPLTRTAFAYIIALGLAMAGFQLAIAGPVVAATLLVPFLIVVGLLAADRSSLRRQQRALRMLVEATLTPIAVPHERARAAPFRRGSGD